MNFVLRSGTDTFLWLSSLCCTVIEVPSFRWFLQYLTMIWKCMPRLASVLSTLSRQQRLQQQQISVNRLLEQTRTNEDQSKVPCLVPEFGNDDVGDDITIKIIRSSYDIKIIYYKTDNINPEYRLRPESLYRRNYLSLISNSINAPKVSYPKNELLFSLYVPVNCDLRSVFYWSEGFYR